jgi:GNAT acetyltransferase-like protein/acetyltransferase (GNAT) family protein
MVVAPEAQRRRLGSQLLDELLAEAERQSIGVVGLVATPFGRPLYESRDFSVTGELAVLSGTPELHALSTAALPITDPGLPERLDRRFISCSRAQVLSARFGVAVATACLPNAYGMATAFEGQALVGPVIAETEGEARQIASALFAAVKRPVRIDVPVEHDGFRAWLRGLGLGELGVRPEMARGSTRLPWQVPERFALIAQAWG